MGETGESRAWLLTSPWFAGSVALLALNDHVLKAAWPGFVTGKLSDVAGVAMVAIALTALLGRRSVAFAMTATAFTLLKTVPAVAASAAPVLGGITRTDPTDLLALAVLIPVWHVSRPRPAPAGRGRRSPVLRIVMVGLAIVVTSATSTDGERDIEVAGSEVFGRTPDDVYRSRDGGLTWQRVRPRSVPRADGFGREQACVGDVCWSADDRGLIRVEDGNEVVVRPATPEAFGSGRAADFVTVRVDDVEYVVGWFPDGAARISSDGAVSWRPFTEFDRSLPQDWARDVSLLCLFVAPASMVVVSAVVRPAALRRRRGFALAIGITAGLMFAGALPVTLLALLGLPTSALVAVAVVYVVIAVAMIAWAVSRPSRPPPLSPDALSRSGGGAPLPPPDGDGRVG